MRVPFVVATFAFALLAGCVETPPVDDGGKTQAIYDLVASTEPLWRNPQTASHPAFGFPTLTQPALGLNGSDVPEFWTPIPAVDLPARIAGMSHVAQAPKSRQGAGMSVFGSLAVVPGFGGSSYVYDISDPTKPQVLSKLSGRLERNVDFIPYPDGRLVIIMATDNDVLHLYDITNPRDPIELESIRPTTTAHKVNVVPGTPIAYNANSNGGNLGRGNTEQTATGITEIYDLSDPENPELVADWRNGYGCHHIYFYIEPSQDYYRAICAGIEVTQLWDIKDPRDPKVVVTIPVHHGAAGTPSGSVPLMAFSHFAILNYDHSVLIVGDEMGGGGLPPGCTVGAQTPVRDATAPTGALWFYDVRDEKNPKLLGWYSPGSHLLKNPNPMASCTAHHGRLVPDPAGRDLLAMAFYGAGTVLLDFSDPMAPKMLDQFADGTDTWEVQYYNGWLFTGDLARGMDVLKFR